LYGSPDRVPRGLGGAATIDEKRTALRVRKTTVIRAARSAPVRRAGLRRLVPARRQQEDGRTVRVDLRLLVGGFDDGTAEKVLAGAAKIFCCRASWARRTRRPAAHFKVYAALARPARIAAADATLSSPPGPSRTCCVPRPAEPDGSQGERVGPIAFSQ